MLVMYGYLRTKGQGITRVDVRLHARMFVHCANTYKMYDNNVKYTRHGVSVCE